MDYEENYQKTRTWDSNKYYALALSLNSVFKPNNVFDYGAGMGYLVHAFRSMCIDAEGYDISKYCKKSAYGLAKGFVNNSINLREKYDLIVCNDVLEHIHVHELGKVFMQIKEIAKKDVFFMITYIGNPDLDKDETHITKRTKEWWEYTLMQSGFKIKDDLPLQFPFREMCFRCEI